MNPELLNLIKDVSLPHSGSNLEYTHYTYFNPAQPWSFKSSEYQKFWSDYCRLVEHSIDTDYKDGLLAIGSKPPINVPVIGNLLFEFSESGGMSFNEYYNDKFVARLVSCYQKVLLENFKISENKYELICCVLEPTKDVTHNGDTLVNIRLHFPYCTIDQRYYTRILRPRLIDLMRNMNIFSCIPVQPSNNLGDIIDPSFINTPIPLYGSISKPDHSPLDLTYIYAYINDHDLELHEYTEYNLTDIFKIENIHLIQTNLINIQMFEQINPQSGMTYPLEHWIPLFLSTDYNTVITHPNDNLISVANELHPMNELKGSNGSPKPIQIDNVYETNMDIAEKLITMIDSSKARDENYWLDIGRSIYNCNNEFEGVGYKLWVGFSTSAGRTKEQCEMRWDSFEIENPLTVKTIAWLARKDSPSSYKAWHDKKCEIYLKNAASCTENDIALALYWVYWLDFTCSSAKNKTWYVYKTHRWIPSDNGIELSKLISSKFKDIFQSLITTLSKEAQESYDDYTTEKNNKTIENITKLIRALKTTRTKGNIMREAIELFKDDNFDKFANNNPHYMGVINCVIEVCSDRAIYRDGKPEDYVTMCSHVRYHPEYTWETPMVKKVIKWMRQCFPDEDLYNYVMKLFSSFLRSKNVEKIFPCLTGEGDNSKSMFKQLMELVFGSYSFTFSTETLTGRSGARASQQKALARWAKIAWAQEPDEDATFKNGILKELTGMDKIFANLLYDNGINFDVMFTLLVVANKIPIIPGADKAIINRFRAIPFLSTWIFNAPKSEEEQFATRTFQIDRNFSDQIYSMAPAMLWVLVQTVAQYKREGLPEPLLVKQATETYWEEHDIYRHFQRDCIEEAIDKSLKSTSNLKGINKNSKLTVSEVYNSFRFWLRDTYPNIKAIDQPSMSYELKQRWGKTIEGQWAGIRLKQSAADLTMGGFGTYSSYTNKVAP